MDSNIKGRSLSESEIKELISIKENDIDKFLLEDLFAFKKNKTPKYCPQDYFVLPEGVCYNDKAESTTVGRFIFNRFILTEKTGPIIKYMNYAMDSKKIGKLQDKMGNLFLENEIDSQEMFDFTDKINWIGFNIAYYMNSSLAVDFVTTNPKIKESKEKLLKENANEITNKNVAVVSEIESKLLSEAKEIFKDHPSMHIYNCGGRGSFNNNYKNTSIMRGSIANFADPSQFNISTTSLDEGITPEDFEYYCNLSITGTFGRSVETQDGYLFWNCHPYKLLKLLEYLIKEHRNLL